jgi:hypothetical protein
VRLQRQRLCGFGQRFDQRPLTLIILPADPLFKRCSQSARNTQALATTHAGGFEAWQDISVALLEEASLLRQPDATQRLRISLQRIKEDGMKNTGGRFASGENDGSDR